MAQKQPGIMIYFRDYYSLRSSLNAEEFITVFDAMISYAETGNLPDTSAFSNSALICWRFMQPRIDHDSVSYRKKSEARSAAAKKRWEEEKAKHANASTEANNANDAKHTNALNGKSDANDANDGLHECMPIQFNTNTNSIPIAVADTIPCISTAPNDEEHDLSAQIAAHQRADDLIKRYQLPDADPTREALLEDAEAIGWIKLEDALRQASFSNSRQRVSIAFYRSILYPSTTKGHKTHVEHFASI